MRLASILFILLLMAVAMTSSADVPQTLSYQGVLKNADGSVMPDGTYEIAFRIFNASSGGTALWAEDQIIDLSGGIFNATLGSVTTLDLSFDEPYWLGITVGEDLELTPRVELTSAPYALRAESAGISDHAQQASRADTADYAQHAARADTADFALSGPGGGGDGDWVISGDDMHSAIPGNVGIGISDPTDKLHVGGTVRLTGRVVASGVATGTNKVMAIADGSGMSLGRWTNPDSPASKATVLNGDDFLFFTTDWNDNNHFIVQASGVGIGLGVDGDLFPVHPDISLALKQPGTGLDWVSDGTMAVKANGIEHARFTAGGNVGIGTTNPTTKLHVAGTVRASSFRPEAAVGIARPDDEGQLRIGGGSGFSFVSDGVRGSGIIVYGRDYGGSGAGGSLMLYAMNGKKTHFRHVSNNGSVTDRMVIDSNGRVGIGTTNPATKLHVVGDLCVTGEKNALVPTSQGMTKVYCDESTELWFRDRGEGQLSAGHAHIELDQHFREMVTIGERHPMIVDVQFYGPHGDYYVERNLTGFDVIDPSGGDSVFSWRVEARRKDYEDVRLEVVGRSDLSAEGR